jgi:HlyD family secretion protein
MAESNSEKPDNLVQMLAEEKRREQHNTMDRKIEKKWWTTRRIALIAFIPLFTGFAVYQLLFGVSPSTLNVETDKLTISEVTYGPFQEYIVEQGVALPLTTIYLDAVEGGRVEEVYVEQGVRVEEGQPILRLSNPNLQLNVMQREAELFREVNTLRQTRVNMEQRRLDLRAQMVDLDYRLLQAEREYRRLEKLAQDDLVSLQAFEKGNDEYEYLGRKREVTLET